MVAIKERVLSDGRAAVHNQSIDGIALRVDKSEIKEGAGVQERKFAFFERCVLKIGYDRKNRIRVGDGKGPPIVPASDFYP